MKKLLPYGFKYAGVAIVFAATTLATVYFIYGLRIALPVFAVYSSYLETKLFATFTTNIADEIILVLFIAGFSLIVFSKEKNEIRALNVIRNKAIKKSIITYIIWMGFSILFIFGNGFISVLVLNMIIPFIIYLLIFYGIKNRDLKRRRLQELQNTIIKTLK